MYTVCNDRIQVLNEASALLFCSLQGRREPFRCKGKEALCGEEAPTQFICKVRYWVVQTFPIQPFRSTTERDEHWRGEKRERQMSAVRCDVSRERKKSTEQRLSDVSVAGSKKAPQIHAIINLSAPRTQREYYIWHDDRNSHKCRLVPTALAKYFSEPLPALQHAKQLCYE